MRKEKNSEYLQDLTKVTIILNSALFALTQVLQIVANQEQKLASLEEELRIVKASVGT